MTSNTAPSGWILLALAVVVVAGVLGLASVGSFVAVAGMAAVMVAAIGLLVRWSA